MLHSREVNENLKEGATGARASDKDGKREKERLQMQKKNRQHGFDGTETQSEN